MFRPDPTIAFIPAAREDVVALVESINQPQISIPSKPPQAAQGYLCGVRNPGGSFTVAVGLYLAQSAENVVYLYEPREVPIGSYRAAEAEGHQFLESMGFMLDDLHFRNLSPEQQAQALARVPLFSLPRPAAAASPDAGRAREAALARLLGGF